MTDKLRSNIKLFLITGPGHHAQILIEALSKVLDEDFYYTTYWPKFALYKKNRDGSVALVHKSLLYGLLNKLLWGLAARFPKIFKKKNRHLDWSSALYDRYASTRYTAEPVLWAWTQMSLYTLRKAKLMGAQLVLEYPMIHALEWDHIMKDALGEKVYTESHSYFSKSMLNKMQKETEVVSQINVLSTYAKDTFIKYGCAHAKVKISHLYTENKHFKFIFPNEKSFSNVLKILFVGRIEILKGIKNLVAALKSAEFEYELHLAGKVYDEVLGDLACVKHRVVNHGVVASGPLLELYTQCDLLVLPSLQESFGLVLLEALSCGLPVLASKNTGAPDVVVHGETGYLFDPQDTSELKGGLSFFYEALKIQRRDFSQQCRARALSFSSPDTYCAHIKNILSEVLKASN